MLTTHWLTKAEAKPGNWVRIHSSGSAYGMLSADRQYIWHAAKAEQYWRLAVYRTQRLQLRSDSLLLHGVMVDITTTPTLRDAKAVAAIYCPRRGGIGQLTTAVVDYLKSLD